MNSEQLNQAIAALRAAAVEVQGQPCVRAYVAAQIIGISDGRLRDKAIHGKINRIDIPVTPSVADPHGLQVFHPLDDLIELAHHWIGTRHRRPITEEETRKVLQTVGTKPIEQVAASIGRSPRAVYHILDREGLSVYEAMAQHGLLTIGQFARLVRRHRAVIKRWITDADMPATRRPGKQAQYMLRLADVRRWLAGRPNVLVHMERDVRRLLRVLPADLEALQKPQKGGKAA